MNIPALSVRAPWWWAILYGGKTIENRVWPTGYRGPIMIHASRWFVDSDVSDDLQDICRIIRANGPGWPAMPTMKSLRVFGGYLVGKAQLVDCIRDSDSPWFSGPWGFVLADAEPLAEPIPCRGKPGLFIPERVA